MVFERRLPDPKQTKSTGSIEQRINDKDAECPFFSW